MNFDDTLEEDIGYSVTEEKFFYAINLIKKYLKNDISNIFYRMINPNITPEAEKWKDLLIKYGYINEKEEIIYKPED